MPSLPRRFPSAEQGCHRGSQGGKPPISPPGTPENDTMGTGLCSMPPEQCCQTWGAVGFVGAAPLRGAQVLHTPAALLAVFHVTRLPALISPCV